MATAQTDLSNSKGIRLILLLLLFAITVYWYLTLHRRQIPDHFNTPEELKIVWSKSVRSQAVSMRFSPDGKFLMTSGGELQGKISRYKNGEYLFDFKVRDKRLSLWKVAQKKQIEKLKAEAIFGGWNGEHMLIMPDFRTLITGSHYSELKVIDVRKRWPDRIIRTATGTVSSLQVSPDEKILAIGTIGGVEFLDAKTLRPLKTYEHYGGNFGANVAFSHDSKTAECYWSGSRISHFINVKTAKRIQAPPTDKDFHGQYSPDGKYFIYSTDGKLMELWRHGKSSDSKISTLHSDLLETYSYQFSPDGKVLAVGGLSSTENPVRFYKLADIRAQHKAL